MKKTYQRPHAIQIQLECEGMIALSKEEVVIKPNHPGTAASNKQDRVWGKDIWGEDE